MVVRGIFYQLVRLVYYSRARSHYWSDVYVKDTNTRNIVTGWYTHDGLNNSGNALLAGGPSFSSDGRFHHVEKDRKLTLITTVAA